MWPFSKKKEIDSTKTADPDRKTDEKKGKIYGDPYVELDE